ncbi:cephalosporin hydroxylase family protein [uncultured Ruegeria sp.]|uniref:cephalosporin hydroxylase family protein n=1 Tax=uncultured Ruegeria sp. TaxID=259304 RepID=UPI002616CFAE|nr:cephalosporin hydroxylase family protein [uncultured Ruegeria sp.]
MTPEDQFEQDTRYELAQMGADAAFKALTLKWMQAANQHKYSYHFHSLGRPIIQYPQDMVAMQQIIWDVRPDLIIETGIAHGGSLIQSAAMLAMLDMCDAISAGETIDPATSKRKVVGIDIDIRSHNEAAIKAHPMASRIDMMQGSAIDPQLVAQVQEIAGGYERVLVCLDSMHSHAHVLEELNAYAHLVSVGSYCIVFDTLIEDLPEAPDNPRPWSVGDNPKTAVEAWLPDNPQFKVDWAVEHSLAASVAPSGYLKRVSA